MSKVFIIVCDTLRAKSLPQYGCKRNTIPNLNRIIDSDFTVYSKAYAPAPWTVPSHISLFTGLYPSQAMELPTSLELSRNAMTLPGLFKDSGYRTIGISTNALVSRKFAFNRDFDVFLQLWLPDEKDDDIFIDRGEANKFKRLLKLVNSPGGTGNLWNYYKQKRYKEHYNIINDATYSTDRTLEILKSMVYRNSSENEFYFVNIMQTHEKYNPPKQTRNILVKNNPDFEAFYRNNSVQDHYAVKPFSKELLRYLKLRYEEEILYLDTMISDFIAHLKENDIYDSSTIVLTSDHGEHFGENGHFTHWFSVGEPVIKIPMYIKWPGKDENRGKSSDDIVSLQDLYSTFSDFLDQVYPCPYSSVSLISSEKRKFIISQLPDIAYSLDGCQKKRADFSLADLGLKDGSLNAYVFENGSKLIENEGNVLEYNLVDDPDEKFPKAANKEILDTIKSKILD
jgi:arylsulfatase A-like enzyme